MSEISELNKVVDFTDLDLPTKFSFKGKEFEIPSISTKKAKELMAMGRKSANEYRKIIEKRKHLDAMLKLKDEGEKIDQEEFDKLDDEVAVANSSFDSQIDFILASLAPESATKEEVAEWPAKMIAKVIKLINDKMSGDDIPETEKKLIREVREFIEIMRVSMGGISIEYLENLPLSKYRILRKAAEIEEIASRRVIISDINAAFSGNKEATKHLMKRYHELTQGEEMLRNKQSDPNWETTLGKGKYIKGAVQPHKTRRSPFVRA